MPRNPGVQPRSRHKQILPQCLVFVCLLHHHALVLGLNNYPLGVTENVVITLGEQGVIKSTTFPSECCDPQVIVLQANSSTGFIHLSFDDLDLPPGTDFKIYNPDTGNLALVESSDMFRQQPDYKFGIWRRPFLSTETGKTFIVLILKPTDSNYDKKDFVGFKASYSYLKASSPYTELTEDLCPVLTSAVDGKEIHIKPQPITYRNKWLDCVWQIKNPGGSKARTIDDTLRTYARFETVNIKTRGKIEIRRGLSSEAPEIASGKTSEDLRQPAEGFLGEHGFYIRAFLPADDRQNKITFMYGVLRYLATGSREDCGTDYLCSAPYNTWCIPATHRCNKINNCPGGDDEYCTSTTTTTTTVHPRTTTKRYCSSWYSECDDGRCVEYSYDCADPGVGAGHCSPRQKLCKDGSCISNPWPSGAACPGECLIYERKCASGKCIPSNKHCPEDPCPYWKTNRCADGEKCYPDDARCDDHTDCADGSDELSCDVPADDNRILYILVSIPIVIILGMVLCFKCCKSNQQSSGQPAITQPAARNFTGVRLQPVVTSSGWPSSSIRRHSNQGARTTHQHPYSPVANGPPDDRPPTGPEPSASPPSYGPPDDRPPTGPEPSAPPPSYDEVITNEGYRPPDQEPPPPSYNKAIQGPQIHILK